MSSYHVFIHKTTATDRFACTEEARPSPSTAFYSNLASTPSHGTPAVGSTILIATSVSVRGFLCCVQQYNFHLLVPFRA